MSLSRPKARKGMRWRIPGRGEAKESTPDHNMLWSPRLQRVSRRSLQSYCHWGNESIDICFVIKEKIHQCVVCQVAGKKRSHLGMIVHNVNDKESKCPAAVWGTNDDVILHWIFHNIAMNQMETSSIFRKAAKNRTPKADQSLSELGTYLPK